MSLIQSVKFNDHIRSDKSNLVIVFSKNLKKSMYELGIKLHSFGASNLGPRF